MSKYDPLRRFLRRRRGEAVQLSFDEIERIIVAFLPKAAHAPDWWSNDPASGPRAVQRRAWLDAGYRAQWLAPETVRFTATTTAAAQPGTARPPEFVKAEAV